MTKQVKRYTQPVVQTIPGEDFKMEEVPLFESPTGKWVRYDDIKHLLQHRYDIHTIISPSAVCGLIGCKNQQVHVHDVREPV